MLVSSVLLGVVGLSSCKTAPPPPDRQAQLVAVAHLQEAGRLVAKAIASEFFKRKHTERAIREQQTARALLVESSS